MKQAKQQSGVEIAGPAVVTSLHMLDRPATDDEGRPQAGKKAWSKLTHFEKAYATLPGRPSKLCCIEICTSPEATKIEIERAMDRRDAGKAFVKKWDAGEPGTKDSLDPTRIRSVGGSGGISDNAMDARRFLALVEANMGKNDWMIVRRVCGENHPVAQTIANISPSYAKSTWPRFREALDALMLAFVEAGKADRARRRQNVARETSQ